MLDKLDLCTQKSHIGHFHVAGLHCAGMHAGALDVDADKILVGEELCHAHGILALAAAELKHNGPVVAKEFVPAAFHRKGVKPLGTEPRERILENEADSIHLGEFAELVLSHQRASFTAASVPSDRRT